MNRTSLLARLNKLDNTQDSIEDAASYCLFYRRQAPLVADIWNEHFYASPTNRHITLLYLANHVLQNSRKKGPEFINAFWKHIPAAIARAYGDAPTDASDKTRDRITRLVRTWDERKLFGTGPAMTALRATCGLNNQDAGASTNKPAEANAAPASKENDAENVDVSAYSVDTTTAALRPSLQKAAETSSKAKLVLEKIREYTNATGGVAAALKEGRVTTEFWAEAIGNGKSMCREAAANLREAADALGEAAARARAHADTFDLAHAEVETADAVVLGAKRKRSEEKDETAAAAVAAAPPAQQQLEEEDSDAEYEPE